MDDQRVDPIDGTGGARRPGLFCNDRSGEQVADLGPIPARAVLLCALKQVLELVLCRYRFVETQK